MCCYLLPLHVWVCGWNMSYITRCVTREVGVTGSDDREDNWAIGDVVIFEIHRLIEIIYCQFTF